MVNANVVISVSAVLVALLITVVFLLTGGSDDPVTVKIVGTLVSPEAPAGMDGQMYYCAGEHCNYYGVDTSAAEWPGYFALVGFQDGATTHLTEFSVGYTFSYTDGVLQECSKIEDPPTVDQVTAMVSGDGASSGSVLQLGDDTTFTIKSVKTAETDIIDAAVFGFSIPTIEECARASQAAGAARRSERRLEAAGEGRELGTTQGYDLWMLSFYTYKTKSGIPTGFDFWKESSDTYDGWNVATGLDVTFTETWRDLPFHTTLGGEEGWLGFLNPKPEGPDRATIWDATPESTLTNSITEGKCGNENSYAKVWVKGNDLTLGFAGTDVFVLSLDPNDVGDILDDVNNYVIDVPYPKGKEAFHAGFVEYVDRIDDCVHAVLDELISQGKTLKYVVGHSLGGAGAR